MTSRSDLPASADPGAAAPDAEALWLGPERASRRLVLLHGWGADADDLLDLGRELVNGLEAGDSVTAVPGSGGTPDGSAGGEVSVVALRAPWPHPGGFGRQWYDLQRPEWPELPEARTRLRARLLALAGSVPLEATALLGFSQGGAMALDVGCGDEAGAEGLPLAALVSCSGYPHPGWRPRRPRPAVLLTHGEQDPVVPYAACEAITSQLQAVGGKVRRIGFRGGHGIEPSLFPAIVEALREGWDGGPG
ncbi:MAG: alpha/beta hydrolase [Cyanobium sp.]